MLNLIAPDRHLVCIEHEDVGRHQHRIAEQAHRNARVRVFTEFDVLVYRRLVSVGTVQQALAGDAGQQPGQFGYLGNIGLAVEGHPIRIQATGQPGCSNFQTRLLDAQRVVAFDQRVVIGEKVEGVGIGLPAGQDGRADGAGVIAQMRRAGGGDTGENSGFHTLISIRSTPAANLLAFR